MTRLRILSDLHLEFGPLDLAYRNEDILVLAGDIGIGTNGAEWAHAYGRANAINVVMVAGNHEFYHGEMTTVSWQLRKMGDAYFQVLDNELMIINGIRFIGAPLWTDYRLGNLDDNQVQGAQILARGQINDHHLIKVGSNSFLPSYAATLHKRSVNFLKSSIVRVSNVPTVILTHHLPSARSIAPCYADDPLNPAYASDLDDLVAVSGAKLWIHGHTHHSADYLIGNTRVLCNPRGYYPQDLNPTFDPDLIVEL